MILIFAQAEVIQALEHARTVLTFGLIPQTASIKFG
jgi:hypothetical protein